MRAVVQRVNSASVAIDGGRCERIDAGMLVYLGVGKGDTAADADYLVDKVRHLRVFSDADGKQNLDVSQAGGGVLVVSAFTVQGDARKGRRPSFDPAAPPALAEELYGHFCEALGRTGLTVKTGSFGSYMRVTCDNDGPICILLDSRKTL